VLVALVLSLSATSATLAGPASPSPGHRALAQDNDGDYLDDQMDPDDDNDGVPDIYDAAPFDPTIGTQPTPGPLSPDEDTDNDGIPNIQDPDSDQDGVADEEDPAPLDPTPVPPPANEDPEPAGGDPSPSEPETVAYAPAPANTDTGERPLVVALPSTGAGPSMVVTGSGITLLAMLATALLLIGWRARRPHGR
jgi:hypothetical protein